MAIGLRGEFLPPFSVFCQTLYGPVRHSQWSGESYLYSRSLHESEALFSISIVIVWRCLGAFDLLAKELFLVCYWPKL